MGSIAKLVEHIETKNADLLNDFTRVGPSIVTCLRVLRHLSCAPENMQTGSKYEGGYSSFGLGIMLQCVWKIYLQKVANISKKLSKVGI